MEVRVVEECELPGKVTPRTCITALEVLADKAFPGNVDHRRSNLLFRPYAPNFDIKQGDVDDLLVNYKELGKKDFHFGKEEWVGEIKKAICEKYSADDWKSVCYKKAPDRLAQMRGTDKKLPISGELIPGYGWSQYAEWTFNVLRKCENDNERDSSVSAMRTYLFSPSEGSDRTESVPVESKEIKEALERPLPEAASNSFDEELRQWAECFAKAMFEDVVVTTAESRVRQNKTANKSAANERRTVVRRMINWSKFEPKPNVRYEFETGFETHEMYKWILNRAVEAGEGAELHIHGRKNSKLDRGEYAPLFKQMHDNGVDVKIIFQASNSEPEVLKKAQNARNFTGKLDSFLLSVSEMLSEAGYKPWEAIRFNRHERKEAILVVDGYVIHAKTIYDKETKKPLHFTNAGFSLEGKETSEAQRLREKFIERWKESMMFADSKK